MGFSSADALYNAITVNGQTLAIPFTKTIYTGATSAAGRWHECLSVGGTGGAMTLTGTAGTGIACTSSTVGALPIGPTVETAQTKQTHADGLTWIHTGDLGMMDEDGFIYFRQRIKRMIVTNGYNVYPSQLENILEGHEYVHLSCVIGVKDPIKMQRVKAFVVLKPGYVPTEACKQELMEYCRKHIAKYAMPSDIEFRDELPKTLVGKVAYRVLEDEEKARIAAQAAQPEA